MTSQTDRRSPAVLTLLLRVISATGAATIEGATARTCLAHLHCFRWSPISAIATACTDLSAAARDLRMRIKTAATSHSKVAGYSHLGIRFVMEMRMV